MSYSYDTLEQILELAAYRLPVGTLGTLIAKVEDVITMNKDGYELEREIQKLICGDENGFRVFKLKKVQDKEASIRKQGSASTAAA